MPTRFALSDLTHQPPVLLVEQARSLGLDAVEVCWNDLDDLSCLELLQARKSGIQTASIDLGAVVDPATLEDQIEAILTFSEQVSNRRLVITGPAANDAAHREVVLRRFVDGLRRIADLTEPRGIALVVRTARSGEVENALLQTTADLRAVLAGANRGNLSAEANLSAFDAAGENPNHSTADLVGRLGHAALGDLNTHRDAGDSIGTLLTDLSAYGYADVVAVSGTPDQVRAAIAQAGGNHHLDTDRISAVQAYMAADGLDGIVLNASKNIVALTGYWPMNGTVLAFVPAQGEPHLFVPAGEETWASRSGWPNIHVYQAGRIADPPLTDSLRAGLTQLATSYQLRSRRIGIEGPFRAQVPPHMAHEVSGRHESLRPVIADAFATQPVFLSERFTRARAAKTEQELRAIRRAAAIADVGLRTFRDGLAEGVRDIDLASQVEAAIEQFGVGYDGVTRVRGYAFVMSGPQTSQTHLDYEYSSTRVQRTGDNVLMELAVVADGYWQDLSRAFIIGEPTPDQQRIYDIAEASFQAAVTAAVPGATGHQVDLAARQVITDAGLTEAYPHQTGHGVGIAFHEQYPLIKPGSEHILESGNVIAIEPGVYIPGIGGVRNEDNLVVGDPAGATSLQTVPHAVSVAG